jgi:hypothetical protein
MRKFIAFLAIGSFFSTVEEFLTVLVLKGEVGSFVFTVLFVFPVYLTLAYLAARLLDRLAGSKPRRDLVLFLGCGIAGVLIEWFLIGLVPWRDPRATPAIVLILHVAMFSFWATVGFAPRLFLDPGVLSGAIRRGILRFYIPYFVVVYGVAFTIPVELRFLVIIAAIVFGYAFLNLFYLVYFVRSFAHAAAARSV